jgi:hypothetical protein
MKNLLRYLNPIRYLFVGQSTSQVPWSGVSDATAATEKEEIARRTFWSFMVIFILEAAVLLYANSMGFTRWTTFLHFTFSMSLVWNGMNIVARYHDEGREKFTLIRWIPVLMFVLALANAFVLVFNAIWPWLQSR